MASVGSTKLWDPGLFVGVSRIGTSLEEFEDTDQIMIRKSKVTEEDLCLRGTHTCYELQLKLCFGEILMKQEKYSQYQEFMFKNVDFVISITKEMKTRKEYKTMSKSCIYFLHLLSIDTSWHQTGRLWDQEELTCLLSDILSMLPKGIVYGVFEVYLEQCEMMNLSIRFLIEIMKSDRVPKYLHSVKIDTYLNLPFKLFWCKKLINEGHADSNIVNRCLNDFCRGKCQENKAKFTVHIISIADNLSDTSFFKELLQCYLRKNLKTVTSMATTLNGNDRSEYNKKSKSAHSKSKEDLIYTQCASILSGNKMKNVDIKQYSRKFNMKGPEDENEVEMQSEQVKLLILFILLSVTTLGHKSAKLKKYLALKYEYHMACLYLLWCSGDIEVHPGPPWRKKQLEHNSERERKWLQDINSILLKLYWRIPTHSKPKNLWQKDNQPEQWPSDKPFYDTKNASKDDKGQKLSDNEILTCLLECLKKKNVVIPQIYQPEISAWTNGNIQLLHKLQVFRIETEKLKSASFNLFLSNLEDDAKDLQNIKVNLENSNLDKMQTEGLVNNDLRQKKQAEIVAEITRDLANTLCRLAKETDPMEKGDGTWNIPPVDWPEDVPFFNPNNRGKNKDKPKCPDKVLVCTFLKLRYMKIPQNIKQIVDAYQTMYNSTNTEEKKKNKDEICRLYTIHTNLAKLDCSLQYLHKEGLFSREVHGILNQWWKTQSVDKNAEYVLKNAIVRSDERPHITIDITKGFEPDADLRYISYTIPIKDAYLHIKCTTVHPNQLNHKQTITGSLITANYPENIEDSVIPPDVTDFVLEHDSVDQTKCPYDNSVMNTDNGPMTFDLQRQENPLPVTHQHLKPHDDLDTLTTHNTLSSDLNGSRCTTEYDTNSLQASDSVYSSNVSTGDNFGCNMGTSKIKRKQLEDKEEPVKKLLKIEVNQCGHYDRIDEDSSSAESKSNGLSLEPNPDSTGNLVKICSDNVLDSWSLDFSLADRNSANNLGAMCECKNSEDIQSCKQMCHLENLVHQNQQYLPENIDEMKNNDNQNDLIEDDKELESFSDLDNFISGKPSQMAKDLLQ
ncbi:unnamed protein product [Mytilus coruscus]|uniref:Uncharacterized protein n=1 Tax=Mytilus coruscus TaxID=42192 RepID=A0A6J8BGY8_MYTCO|nr:unnamed protein product [Mytilus coruscus]